MNNTETKYPADRVAHWSSGPVDCCEQHANDLVALGKFMGLHVAVTTGNPGAECANCRNEAGAEKDQ